MQNFVLEMLACVVQGHLCALRKQGKEVEQSPQISQVLTPKTVIYVSSHLHCFAFLKIG